MQLGASHPERVGWGQQTRWGQHGRELQAQLRERERRVSEEAAGSQDKPELLSSDEVRTGFVSGLTFGPRAVQYAVVDGRAIFEAVILPGSQFRWPNGTVPFDIDPACPTKQRVADAISHWESNTVIRFVERTPANAGSHPNFVHFQPGGGCSSAVGMRGRAAGDHAGHRL